MLLFVENKRIFAGLSVSRWGWLLHNAELARHYEPRKISLWFQRKRRGQWCL